ncbi:MAG: KEOPS complex subunit Cgi121 [Methanolobus sp.]
MEKSVSELKSLIEEAEVIEYSDSKREDILDQFSITEKEVEAVGEEMIPSLVIERVALVDIIK